ncbi:hypothetical protein E3P78_03792 [Wallemia ichthyophaga]|nr:hypothetical protein E3P78_03792 [Wallemia ichthyophaga]
MERNAGHEVERERPTRAKKKIKCNGPAKFPEICSNCKTFHLECSYNDPAPKRGFTVAYVRELERKVSFYIACASPSLTLYKVSLYEALVERLAPGRNLHEDVESVASTTAIMPPKRRRVDSDSGLSSSLASTQLDTPSTSSLPQNPSKIGHEDDELEHPSDSDDESGLHEEQEHRYFRGVKGILKTLKSYSAGPSTPPLSTQQRPEYWSPHKHLEEDSYIDPYSNEDFGDERLYMLLVEIYFEKVNSTLPLLNKKRFVAEVRHRKLERKFASILILVCALGALYCDDPRVLNQPERFRFLSGSSFLATYKRKSPDYSLSAATLEDIQALILLQMFVQRSAHLKSSWNLNGAALVIAEDMGLHMQQTDLGDNEREARNRAFYCIYLFDRSLSAAYGRRILFEDEILNLELPKLLPEECGAEEEYSVLYFNQMVKLYSIQGQITQALHSLKNANEKEDITKVVACMSSNLNRWLEEIPEKLRYKDECTNQFVFQLMGNLRIAFFNIQIFMYKNFVPHPHTKKVSKFKMQSLMICANAARSLLSIFNIMELKRSIVQNYIDVMLNLSPFTAVVILILSACESRRCGQDDQNSDLEYIETGVNVLRRREFRDIIAGKSLDVVLHLIEACQLPVDTTLKRRRSNDMHSAWLKPMTDMNSVDSTSALDDSGTERDDQLLLTNMFNLMQSNPIDSTFDSTFNDLVTPTHNADLEWNDFLTSVFQNH